MQGIPWRTYTLLILLPFVAFGRSMMQGFSPIDDSFLIIENLAIRGLTWENLRTVFTTYDPELYIPLTFLSFQINYVFSGLAPWSYHLTNIILHGVNAILVWRLLLMLNMRRRWALFAGAVFAVHPIHTEAVAWIAGRKDILSTLPYLLSLIFYVSYRRGSTYAYAGSIACALLALLAKAMAVTLPAALILMDLLIERRRLDRRAILDKIPFVGLSLLFMIIAMGGKERVIGSIAPFETILMAGRSAIFYVEKFLLPHALSVFYTHRGPISLTDHRFFVPWIILLAALSGLALILFKQRRGMSESASKISFGSLFFLSTLAPTFLNFQKGAETFVAVDRYAYLPSIGLLMIFGEIIANLTLERKALVRRWIACLWIAVLTGLSMLQTRHWDSAESLFTHAMRIHPEALVTRISVAKMLRERGDLQEAFDVLKEGLAYGDSPYLHLSAGAILARSGRTNDAAGEFQKAITMDPMNPEPYFALGSLMEQLGDSHEAEKYYVEASELDASYVLPRVRIAQIALEDGRDEDAEKWLQEGLRWNRNSADAHASMGLLRKKKGRIREALEHFTSAATLRPHDIEILLTLAETEMELGNMIHARNLLERVLRIDRVNARAKNLLQEF